ncbi:amiloride-sensitive sodium channel subunit delta [Sylvia atricapilla]|uniref:amiloride-sensitive sodium channel subunit delta n=1 Tax=Sylvia atricapilla TaxID=48155 RepID=UPI0033991C6F
MDVDPAAARQEGLIELYGSFQEMFEFFCKNTTIHGTVRLVCSGRNRMKTAFWSLLLLASLGMLYWQFALMLRQFWAYPVVLTMSMHSEPKMFPAVTVCNLDPYRFEVVSEHLAQLDRMAEESITFLYGINTSAGFFHTKGGKIHLQALANVSSSGFKLSHNFSLLRMSELRAGKRHSRVGFRLCNSTGGNCFLQTFSSGLDALQEWYRFHYMNIMARLPLPVAVSPQEEQHLLYSCHYDGEPCRPSDYIQFHHPVFGSCYTFNSEGTDPFWTATKPGIPYGLSLLLRARQRGHIPLLSSVAGVRVMIHTHGQSPFLEHEAFDVRPGTAAALGIRQDEVKRLGGNYGKCTRAGEDVSVELLYNSSYSLQACLHSCFQHTMLRECGCGYLYFPLPPGAPRCDYNTHPAWGHCFYRLYNRLRNHHLNCFQQCPKPCRESLYKVSAGTAKWPSAKSQDWVRQALRHQHGYNSTSSRRDIAKVTIFYQQLNYQAVHEAPLLSENLLLSSMGSQWSLWFGSSVLSVVEMLELLVDTLALSLLFLFQRLKARRVPEATPGVTLALENPQEQPGKEQEGFGNSLGIQMCPEVLQEGFGNCQETDLGEGRGAEGVL